MTLEQHNELRRKIYNIVRKSYHDSDIFPEDYYHALNHGRADGDGLAHFIAVEIWEVMEGQDTLDGCRQEAIFALKNAQEDLQTVIDALEIVND